MASVIGSPSTSSGQPVRHPDATGGRRPEIVFPDSRPSKRGPRPRQDVSFDPGTDRFRQKLTSVRRSKGNLITPEIRATDPTYRRFSARLAERLSSAFPKSSTANGFYKLPAIPSDFRGLYAASGVWMNPAGSPPTSRSTKAESFVSPRHKRLLELMVRLLTRRWVAKNYHISKISSTGLPHFKSDVPLKWLLYSRFWDAVPDMKLALASRDLELLWDRHGMLAAYFVGRRAQVDKMVRLPDGGYMSKVRPVTDWLGNRLDADKRAMTRAGEEVVAMRTRLVYAFAGGLNYGLGAVWSGYKNWMRHEYGYTYRHGSRDAMLRKMAGFASGFSLDVKNFDQNLPRFLVHLIVELNEHLSMTMRQMTLLALQAPIWIPNDYEGGRGSVWSGHPLKMDHFDADYGNPSGLGPNFYFNYVIGAFLVLVGLLESGLFTDADLTEERLDAFFRGQHPVVALWNSGDDNVLLFRSAASRDRAYAYFSGGLHPYFDLEVEEGMTFLGTLYAEEAGTRYACPNPVSLPLNWLAPERGWDSPHRPFPGFGWFNRKPDFSGSPRSKDIDLAINEEFKSDYGITLDAHLTPYVRAPFGRGRVNVATMEFMLNPEVLHYKGRMDEIDPAMLDLLVLSIPAEHLAATAGLQVKEVSFAT